MIEPPSEKAEPFNSLGSPALAGFVRAQAWGHEKGTVMQK